MSKRDVFKVLGCEGEPPLRKVTLEAWLQEEDACEYVPGSTVTLEFIGRQMPDPEMTRQAAPAAVVNTSDSLKGNAAVNATITSEEDFPAPVFDAEEPDHNGN